VALVFSKIVEDLPDKVANKQILDLHSFWMSNRCGNDLPDLASFTKEQLFFIWSRLMIVRRAGDDFEYLHYGARIAEAAGFDMTGKRTSDFQSEVGDFFHATYLECLSAKSPVYTTHHAEHAASVRSWERLALPVVDGEGVEHIVCYNQPLDRKSLLFDTLMEANVDGIALYRPEFDENGKLVDMIFHMVNRYVCETFGMAESDMIGRGLCELFPGAESDALPYYAGLLETGKPCEFERRFRFGDRTIYLLFKATKFQDRVLTVATDITELRQAQEEADQLLRQSNRDRMVLKALIDVIPMPIFRRDSAGRFDLLNNAYANLVGVPGEDIHGKTLEEVYGPETAENISAQDAELFANPGSTQTSEIHTTTLQGEVGRDVVFHKASLILEGDRLPSIVGAAVDVTEEKALRNELEHLAMADPLTGIANRRKFMATLDAETARSVRYRHPVSLITIDIDRFKSVNDTYGHAMGDEAIKAVADVLEGEVRRKIDLPARIGGEEFAVLLPEVREDRAVAFAERIRKRVEATIVAHKDQKISVTVSIGVAQTFDGLDPDNPAELLVRADQALYVSKSNGRNRTSTFQASERLPLAG